jgi:PAS domain S-box-containing protein
MSRGGDVLDVGRPSRTAAGGGTEPAADAWTWECGPDGRVRSLSAEFEQSTRLPARSLLGTVLSQIVPSNPEGAAQIAAIAAGKPFWNLLLKIDGADGRGVWLALSGAPIGGGKGKGKRYRGIGKTVTEDAEAAHARAASERRSRELFELASDWFWEMDANGRLTYVSPNIEAVLGLPVSTYIGKRVPETEGIVIDVEAARANLAAFRARRPYRDFVYSRRLGDGRVVWISSSGAPYYGEDGAFLGYRGVARDVTVQIEAEKALRESEQQYRQLMDAAADWYWEHDAENRLTYVSPNYEKLFGVPLDKVIGSRLTDQPGVTIDAERGAVVVRAFRARKPYRDFVYARIGADGKKRWFKTTGAPIFDRNGNFTGYRGIGADITDHIKAEAMLRLSQQRLQEALAYVTQPVVVYDAEDRLVVYNQAFLELHRAIGTTQGYVPILPGLSFREVAELQLSNGIYADDRDDAAIDLEKLTASYSEEAEHAYHLRDGRWMMVIYRGLPGGGRVGLWTDITAVKRAEAERRSLEARLQHTQRLEALGTLAGGAAHEINNALVPVLALTKSVASKLPEGSRERRNLDMVVTGAERSRDLVKQILAFSRNEEVHSQEESVDLGSVLHGALAMLRATVPTTIHFEQEIAPIPPIAGDAKQLQQVIVNLVTNAAQAIGPAPGRITVGLRPDDDGTRLRLSVADTGCGMDDATVARIFEPFFTTKPVGEGTGLGLSVAHGIVKAHGGSIEVKSTRGQGSRFDIFFPVHSAGADKGKAA